VRTGGMGTAQPQRHRYRPRDLRLPRARRAAKVPAKEGKVRKAGWGQENRLLPRVSQERTLLKQRQLNRLRSPVVRKGLHHSPRVGG